MSIQTKRFFTSLRNDDPIVRDHRVHDVRIMPGVTFIDVVLKALGAASVSPCDVELRKVLFHDVVATSERFDREIRVDLEPHAGGVRVGIASRRIEPGAPPQAEFEENVSCEAVLGPTTAAVPGLDLDGLKAAAREVLDLDEIYALARSMRIEHGPFMKTEGRVYRGRDYVLGEVALSNVARQYLDDFELHPALMDAATLPYAALLDGLGQAVGKAPFIPIYVESFRVWQLPRDKIHVLVRQGPRTQAFADVVYNDIEVLDETGAPVAVFRRLGAKRIRTPELITRRVAAVAGLASAPSAVPAQPAASAAPGTEPGDGVASRIQRALCGMVAELLRTPAEAVDTDAGFYDLGLESTDLLKLVQRLEQHIGEELYPTLLFEYSSIARLTEYLGREHAGAFAESAVTANARESAARPEPKAGPSASSDPVEVALLAPCWHASPCSVSAGLDGRAPMLLFTDRAADAERTRGLSAFANLHWVERGSEYAARGERWTVIDRDSTADYARVLEAYEAMDVPVVVVHWPSACGPAPAAARAPLGGLARYPEEFDTVKSAHALLRALLASRAAKSFRFIHVASGEHSGAGAAVAGLLRTLALEAPELAAQVVYLDQELGQDVDRALVELHAELAQPPGSRALEVAYGSGARRVRALEPAPAVATPVPLRADGTYVVSGGAGGLGLSFAEHLSRKYDARLLLFGRSPLSAAQQERLERLKDAGRRIAYAQCDVTSPEEVKRTLRAAKQRLSTVRGVIHAAGVAVDGLFRAQGFERCTATFATKVLGALVLDEATRDDDLEFFAVFSSLSALTGNVGQSAYGAANAWLDAFAHERQRLVTSGQRSGRTLSINWPLWAAGGMHPGAHAARALERSFGLVELEVEEGVTLFERALGTGAAQVAVYKGRQPSMREALTNLCPPAPRAGETRETRQASSPHEPTQVAANAASSAREACDMAIIGVSGRYPDAPDLEAFWRNLEAGRDSVSVIPGERWDCERYFHPERGVPGKSYAKWGGFLSDVDQFDPLFFNVTPNEAAAMDPQERLFLECAWAVLEDAGYTPSLSHDATARRERNVGVFVGAMWQEYQLLAVEETLRGNPVLAGASAAMIANRVSYCLDLHGPSVPVDTMCSSSLMAIHLACESLRRGESSMAIAGGVNLMLHPSKYVKLCQLQMLSSDGRCRSFGRGGDGYVPGEGVGCVLLKPLERAIADGDPIYAIIRSTHANHGGKTGGVTVPSPAAQARLIREGLRKSGLPASAIGYIEAHGTGTALGDPIEIDGLTRAFTSDGRLPEPCPIGSVKSNIGHLEAAAGIAAITKVVLQLEHQMLVPSLHAEELNEKIDFDGAPFVLQRSREPWRRRVIQGERGSLELPRAASVSSFGAGGVNVHVVLEEYVASDASKPASSTEPELIVLSAKKESVLRAYAVRLQQKLESVLAAGSPSVEPLSLADVAFTLQRGREPFRHRLALVVDSLETLRERLRAYASNGELAQDAFTGDAKLGKGTSAEGPLNRASEPAGSSELARCACRWVLGDAVDLGAVSGTAGGRRVPLPTYPFDRKRHWIAQSEPARDRHAKPEQVKHAEGLGPSLEQLQSDTEQRLIHLLAAEIGLAEEEVEVDESFEQYGIDSVVGAQLLGHMEQLYGDLPVALMLERRSLAAVARYLVEHRREQVLKQTEAGGRGAAPRRFHERSAQTAKIGADG